MIIKRTAVRVSVYILDVACLRFLVIASNIRQSSFRTAYFQYQSIRTI